MHMHIGRKYKTFEICLGLIFGVFRCWAQSYTNGYQNIDNKLGSWGSLTISIDERNNTSDMGPSCITRQLGWPRHWLFFFFFHSLLSILTLSQIFLLKWVLPTKLLRRLGSRQTALLGARKVRGIPGEASSRFRISFPYLWALLELRKLMPHICTV